MRNLKALGNQVSVPIEPDEDGYTGRECPVEDCRGYFKITFGTGLTEPGPCHCPYCGHTGEHNTFWTQEQLEYARSMVMRQLTDAVRKDFKSLEFDHKPQGAFGIGFSMKLQPSSPHPIHYYREKELETHVVCTSCTLRYAIYGVFGWCPDCGMHNSLPILAKNLELARKELALAQAADADLATYLVSDALKNVVSAFDGFGRAVSSERGHEVRFQNLQGARRNIIDRFGFDFAEGLSTEEWVLICRIFQKRHLLSHKMGVIDKDYVQKSEDPTAIVGRKLHVDPDEVEMALDIIQRIGDRLHNGIFHGQTTD